MLFFAFEQKIQIAVNQINLQTFDKLLTLAIKMLTSIVLEEPINPSNITEMNFTHTIEAFIELTNVVGILSLQ